MSQQLTLTPAQIVTELDRYIVGQERAKRAVAIALRNRWRRQNLPPELRDEVAPKNIIMIGPTGVGKTEVARRLAKLAQAPFLKVEASKYTEVGYVGRDVESMIRDLTELSVNMVKAEMMNELSRSATASSASSRRRTRSVRQSLATSTAARGRLPRCSSSRLSKRAKSVKASAAVPAKPASTRSW